MNFYMNENNSKSLYSSSMPRRPRQAGRGRRPYQLRRRGQRDPVAPPQRVEQAQPEPVQRPQAAAPVQAPIPPPPPAARDPVVNQPQAVPNVNVVAQELPVQSQQPLGNLDISNNIDRSTQPPQNEPLLVPGFSDETDVFISQTLKEKVWNFEYVDLSQFLRQNFENSVEEKGSNLEIINGKLVLQPRKRKTKSIDNISLWTNAFLTYTLVLIENHPNKASELIHYMLVLRNVAQENPNARWITYDQQFRLRVSRNPSRSWNTIDGDLWLRFIATCTSTSLGRTNFSQQKTPSKLCCYDYNYKGICNKKPCYYRHVCLKCQAQHPSIHCMINSTVQGAINPSKANVNYRSTLQKPTFAKSKMTGNQ